MPSLPGYLSLSQIFANVVQDTARPDLDITENGGDDTVFRAVMDATLTLHSMDFWFKDLLTADITFDAEAFIQQFDKRILTRFRNFAYARKWDPSANASQQNPNILPPLFDGPFSIATNRGLAMLEILEYDEMFDEYNEEKVDVLYMMGDTVFIKSSTSFQFAKLGWYAQPMLDIANRGAAYKSWIADMFPYAIIHMAAGRIFNTTGDTEKYNAYFRAANPNTGDPGGLVTQQIALLKASGISTRGR